jgi:hypothetical protein
MNKRVTLLAWGVAISAAHTLGCGASSSMGAADASSAGQSSDGDVGDSSARLDASPGTASGDADAGSTADAAVHGDAAGGDAAVGTLDCAWTQGNNCWKQTLAPAMSCLPPSGAMGTLSADEKTCTYASGTTITFSQPLNIGPNEMSPGFTVATSGTTCVVYARSSSGYTVKTAAGQVSVTVDATRMDLILTCPDGSIFSGPFAPLMPCQYDLPEDDLGEGFSGTDGGYFGHSEVWFYGTAQPDGGTGQTLLFDCATPDGGG